MQEEAKIEQTPLKDKDHRRARALQGEMEQMCREDNTIDHGTDIAGVADEFALPSAGAVH